jgi:branched-chain amino acid transport system ATP-binding protein
VPEPAALALEGLAKSFGGIVAAAGVDLVLAPGELHALIGPNGAGKTTLVNLITGELAPDAGRVLLAGRDVTRLSVHARARLGLGRTFQLTSILPGFTVLENAALAAQARHGPAYAPLRDALSSPALVAAAEAALAHVGLARLAAAPAATLAHGRRRRLELAMVLAGGPSILLLDEPMAGLGPEESAEMIALLRALKGRRPILLVEHDMDAVWALADRVSVLVGGKVLARGSPDAVRRDPEARRAYLGEGQP